MKFSLFLIPLIIWLIRIDAIHGQNSLRIFTGVNITNTTQHLINRTTNSDTSYHRKNNYILPLLGMDIEFLVNPKLNISSGLGVSWMGSRNYQNVSSSFLNIDSNLRLGYLRIPLILNYKIFNNMQIIGGYSFNYNFRKNQLLNTFDENNNTINTYRPIHHGALFGFRSDFFPWSIVVNYHLGLSRIRDTKDYHKYYRNYLTLGGLQISIGYLIKEKE